ncbi:CinA family protein [Roseomonas sp. F4]
MLPATTLEDAQRLLAELQARGMTLATAESCTGGLIAAALTAIPGSSATLLAGYVTYSNEAKTAMVGVPAALIDSVGAVSEAVARRMAEGALRASGASLAISCTGIAGPGGGSAAKPVGLVHMACARDGLRTLSLKKIFPGDRTAIRAATVAAAFTLIRRALEPTA